VDESGELVPVRFQLNPFTGNLDIAGLTLGFADSRYYKPDGSNANGELWLDATTKFKKEGGQVNFYVNGNIEQSWQYTPRVAGEAMGNLGGVYA
jgi:hypothetical protein